MLDTDVSWHWKQHKMGNLTLLWLNWGLNSPKAELKKQQPHRVPLAHRSTPQPAKECLNSIVLGLRWERLKTSSQSSANTLRFIPVQPGGAAYRDQKSCCEVVTGLMINICMHTNHLEAFFYLSRILLPVACPQMLLLPPNKQAERNAHQNPSWHMG